MDLCMCGSVFHINAGDSIQNGIYRWYASYHCAKCGSSVEIDGCKIDSIPDDIKSLIMKKEGAWRIESLAGKAKTKYVVNKILQDNYLDFEKGIYFTGTENQVKWLKTVLNKKGMMENEIVLKKIS